ncbi:pimeloyl-ACP methyl ester carboxylesterase [Stella humosa]|uniref:Pimeloyl-ACP methyl ester carboxylesterase n=1 Tax=Stella humosa TaxID=94 RepID=A0A3N1KVQ5_9PROT|nr:alpha/beta hydrolase [Stella humosa]ROP81395.1 pimeloyl-ACP methyl ester carboxylesterase [Stella humosa]BBK32746.1 hydrolase [Stella humosa]
MTTVPPEAQSRFLTAYSDRAFYRLHCTCWGIERVGPTAILLHGFMQNGREFDPLARRLALAGWRVFCPDFPGHGGTAWWHDGQYSPAAYASAVATTITAAGVPGVHLIGGSMGGGIAMRMAASRGIPLHSVVINDVGLEWPLAGLEQQSDLYPRRMTFATLQPARDAVIRFTSDRGQISEADLQDVVRYSLRRLPDGRFAFRCDPRLLAAEGAMRLRRRNSDRSAIWAAIPAPILLIRGGRSLMFEAHIAQQMLELNPRAELLTMPDSGHPPWLRTPDQIEPVVEWLNRQARAVRERKAGQPAPT